MLLATELVFIKHLDSWGIFCLIPLRFALRFALCAILFCSLHVRELRSLVGFVGAWELVYGNHRRRMEFEDKAKVVGSIWGSEFVPFLAALAVLPWSI